MASVGFSHHDHRTCISEAVAAAEDHCRRNGLQLTPVRRRVLEILLQQHRGMGAYEILDILRTEGFGSQPPVVYRALAFLTEHGFVHRVEKLNAFIACSHPGDSHDPAFLICRVCSSVAEAQAEPRGGALGRSARDAGFRIETAVVEAEGICPNCQAHA